jgi:hypothetical protein
MSQPTATSQDPGRMDGHDLPVSLLVQAKAIRARRIAAAFQRARQTPAQSTAEDVESPMEIFQETATHMRA